MSKTAKALHCFEALLLCLAQVWPKAGCCNQYVFSLIAQLWVPLPGTGWPQDLSDTKNRSSGPHRPSMEKAMAVARNLVWRSQTGGLITVQVYYRRSQFFLFLCAAGLLQGLITAVHHLGVGVCN